MKFAVYAPDYTPFSGGIIALHRLCENIKNLGEECVITTQPVPDPENTMAIYGELVVGNPLGAKHVMRWLLNTPGAIGGDGKYGENDLIYKFADYFKAPDESKVLGLLTAFELNLDVFYNRKYLQRSGRCYANMKYKADVHEPQESIRIDGYSGRGGNKWLADKFNECETFYCYDNACFLAAQAALCGCQVIVHDDGKTSKEDWHNKFAYFKYGIAYGKGDTGYARETLHMVAGHMRELEELSIKQCREFVEKAKSLL